MNERVFVRDKNNVVNLGVAHKRGEVLARNQKNVGVLSAALGYEASFRGKAVEQALGVLMAPKMMQYGLKLTSDRHPLDIVTAIGDIGVADIKSSFGGVIKTSLIQRIKGVFIVIDGMFNVGVYSYGTVNESLVYICLQLIKGI